MILGGASITFATANAFLSLLGSGKLKRKEVMQVLGKVPNIEKLERMTLFGLRVGFGLITIGLVIGLGLAVLKSTALGMNFLDWLTDAKIVLIIAVWVLLGIILMLRYKVALKGRTIAYMTIVAFILILFAIVGTTIFCGTTHDFTKGNIKVVEVRS